MPDIKTARQKLATVTAEYSRRLNELPADARAGDIKSLETIYGKRIVAAEAEVRKAEAAAPAAPAARVSVTEPVTYDPRNAQRSFIADLYRVQQGGSNSSEARARLERNNVESRALNSSTTTGGDFLPPAYFGDLYAEYKRARRVLSSLMRSIPLPASGETITVPRMTGGGSVTAQNGDNTNISTQDAITAPLTVPVCTVGSYADLSRQIVERSEPGLDQIVMNDLFRGYNSEIESLAINGLGTAGQPTGLMHQASVNSITYTSAAPKVYELYPHLLDAQRQVTEAVFEPSHSYVMTARRWAWMLASLDDSHRPLVVPNANGPWNAIGVTNANNASFVDNLTPAGFVGGIPVYVSELLPKTGGGSTNCDVIVSGAWNEAIIWEDAAPRSFRFDGVLSQTATIRVQLIGYVALTFGRFPAAFSIISGSGLAAPTFS